MHVSPRDNAWNHLHSKMKISVENLKANGKSLYRQNPQMTLKPVPTFGRSKVTASIVIRMNFGFNSTCRRRKHSLFHRNTLILQGLLILIWICHKKRGLKSLTLTGVHGHLTCKTKATQETEKSFREFLKPSEKPKVIFTDNSLEFSKSCEDLSWNH